MSEGISEAPSHRGAYLAAVVATVLAYANSLTDGFVFDDIFAVLKNPAVTEGFSLQRIFTTDIWGLSPRDGHFIGTFRPLMILSFASDWHLGGGHPWIFHATNVLLQAVASLAFVRLLAEHKLSRAAVLFAAVLFAVHPMHTDAVTSIVGRSELLWFTFAVGLLFAHRSDRWRAAVAAPVLLALGLASKESMLFALPLLAFDDLSRLRWNRLLPLRWATYAGVLVAVARWRTHLFGTAVGTGVGPITNPFKSAALDARIVTGLAGIGRGFKLLVAPTELQPDYGLGVTVPTATPSVWTFVGALALLGLTAAVLMNARRRPAVALAALWMAVPVVAGSNLPFVVTAAFAERLWYAPSAGFVLLLAEGIDRVLPKLRPALAHGLLGVTVLLFGAMTAARNLDWRNDVQLFVRAVEVSPNGVLGRLNLCQALTVRGRHDLAIPHCTAAARLAPGWGPTRFSRAVALERLGRYDEAETEFEALSHTSDVLPGMRAEYGHFLYERRDPARAKRYLLALMDAPTATEAERATYLRALLTLAPTARGPITLQPMGR